MTSSQQIIFFLQIFGFCIFDFWFLDFGGVKCFFDGQKLFIKKQHIMTIFMGLVTDFFQKSMQ